MDAKATSSISRLPQQLLVRVMSHVELAERMCSCALVSAAWHNAAVLATSSIFVHSNSKSSLRHGAVFNSLSTWLQQHAAAAPIKSITAVANSSWAQVLQLPAEQLKLLRDLVLSGVNIMPCAVDETDEASTCVLPLALSALTHLALNCCHVQLSTLPAFTQLQHLVLQERIGVESSQVSALGDAIPSMQRLTHLALGGVYAQDSVLAGVVRLSRLQALLLHGSSCTAASFEALPASLTQLEVQAEDLHVSRASTPGFTQLTALRRLVLNNAEQWDITLLDNMHSLQHLVLDVNRVQLAATQPRLAAWAGLTALQHLDLSVVHPLRLHTPADVSALTASSHLTLLHLRGGVVAGEHYSSLFPEGRQLPLLRSLHASMGLLSQFDTVEGLTKCCVNLETLDLSANGAGDVEWEANGDHPPTYSASALASLSALRCLVLHSAALEFSATTWKSLAYLTSLKVLDIRGSVPWQGFGGVTSLAACKQLMKLRMAVGHDHDNDEFELVSEAPAGCPPDVWRRLPVAAMELALDYYDQAVDVNYDQQDALVRLARSAAGHTAIMQQEHQQLQQELVDLQKLYRAQQQEHRQLQVEHQQLQVEQQRQQQEVDELQAALAVIRPQLQAT